jgi:hypothetical protein
MKILVIITALVLASCTGNHPGRYNVDINELKTLPDNSYAYFRGTIIVHKQDEVMIWYNIDDDGNIVNISKILDQKDPKATTTQAIEKYALDTVTEKAAAVLFTQLSHKYHFGHINVDHKNKISYSTNEDIVEEYTYPLNDSLLNLYKNNFGFERLENGWFRRKD